MLEELAFRGVLPALVGGSFGGGWWRATLVSSGFFGLWHVLPAMGSGGAVSDTLGSAGAVVGTVLFTAAAGVVFRAWQRWSGHLVTPMLLHAATNSLGRPCVGLAAHAPPRRRLRASSAPPPRRAAHPAPGPGSAPVHGEIRARHGALRARTTAEVRRATGIQRSATGSPRSSGSDPRPEHLRPGRRPSATGARQGRLRHRPVGHRRSPAPRPATNASCARTAADHRLRGRPAVKRDPVRHLQPGVPAGRACTTRTTSPPGALAPPAAGVTAGVEHDHARCCPAAARACPDVGRRPGAAR